MNWCFWARGGGQPTPWGLVGSAAREVGGEAQSPGAPAAQAGETASLSFGEILLFTQWYPLSLAYSDFRNKTECLVSKSTEIRVNRSEVEQDEWHGSVPTAVLFLYVSTCFPTPFQWSLTQTLFQLLYIPPSPTRRCTRARTHTYFTPTKNHTSKERWERR